MTGRGAGQDISIRCDVVCGQSGLVGEEVGSVSMRLGVERPQGFVRPYSIPCNSVMHQIAIRALKLGMISVVNQGIISAVN